MARNLYDLGDRETDQDDDWLKKRRSRRAKILPLSLVAAALIVGLACLALLRALLPASGAPAAGPAASDAVAINQDFALCDDPRGVACVLSAGRFSWCGEAYHLADVSVPDPDEPRCPAEEQMARQGRQTLLSMLNGGAFEMRPDPSDSDDHARILMRDGMSLGQILILKGLAKPWSKQPLDWCKGVAKALP